MKSKWNKKRRSNSSIFTKYTRNSNSISQHFITLGAIWSSCSPDFGTAGVVDRFSQISPKILFIGDKYFYNGKKINILERLPTNS